MKKYRFIDPLTNKDATKFRKGNRVHHKDTPNLIGTVRKGNYKGYGSLDVQLESLATILYDVKDVVKIK
ncbi:hypothetical protein FDB50_15560 [Clostridium botulinum]|uniref:Uncharacterized protein n=1 Tax=Clostridium botulinum TaxID=1491 RepID=A0A846JV93_CLOBO|nr:hypothetical protein [Clostridium botulinum]MBY7043768.1 hypothetical protein [Clostridium botulinum]NFN06121.1 hypothetical protein [Clostridium botulinum]NFN36457.1 hypothetical protein [Clostridium botulinum]